MVESGIRSTKLAVSVGLAAAVVGLGLAGGAGFTGTESGSPVPVPVADARTGAPAWLVGSAWTAGAAGSHATAPSVVPVAASPVTTASTAPAATTPTSVAETAAATSASSPAATDPAASGTPIAVSAPPVTAAATSASEASAVAELVRAVGATGIEPGPTWSWSMGDTATQCGAIPGNVGTGCTSGAAGAARTVFSGSPTLALVAHEMANAEVENDAVPSLMSEVATAEAGTSWSTIDAAATCLVVHFMGFQDQAAGAWECPAALASVVADHIHD